MVMTEERFLPVGRVANRLGLTSQTIRLWIKQGRLRAVQPGGERGARWLIPQSEVDRLLGERSRGDDGED